MRFEVENGGMSLSELFAAVEDSSAELLRGADIRVDAVAPLNINAANTLSFSNPTPARTLGNNTLTALSVVVAKRKADQEIPANWPDEVGLVLASNPRRWFIQAVRVLFAAQLRPNSGIHRLANVEAGAKIDPTAHIGAFVTIGQDAQIGPGAVVETGAIIGARTQLARDVRIGPNTVLGVSGLALERGDDDRQIHLPHLGAIEVGESTMIGANSVVVRGSLTNTIIGAGCMIGNLVNIGHNIQIGDDCFVGPKTVLCGSVRLGRRCWIAPGVTVLNKMRIGDNAMIGLGSVVMRPVPTDGYVLGNPAKPTPKINRLNKYNR